ncbi:MAG: M20 family metallopeptidase [Gammaproteobacteria bacterium]
MEKLGRTYQFLLSLALLGIGPAAYAAEAVEPSITASEQQLISWLDEQDDAMLDMVERVVNINSGSLNSEGIAAVGEIFSNELRQLGFEISTLPGDFIGMPSCPGSNYSVDLSDHILATKPGNGPRILLMGHLDTVFPPDSPFQTFRTEGDTMYGPGVADMQSGLVIMLYALKALEQSGELEDMTISVLLNSDEEMGSLSSRKYLEEQAQLHDFGLVYESSGNNTLVRTRKGLGQVRFVVNGRASHAGAAHQEGRSAIKELAYKIVEIERMTDYESGVTVNVGVISGGEARNTVAPCAEAFVDLRYPEPAQGEQAVSEFNRIFSEVYSYAGATADLSTEQWINLHRPPKIPTPESDALLDKAVSIGRLLGQELGVIDSGGGSDGSLTQAVGLPTVDSLGAAWSGAHSNREEARISSLVERAQLSAVLIRRLTRP